MPVLKFLLDKNRNSAVLIIGGFWILFNSEMPYFAILGALIAMIGLNPIANKAWGIIVDFYNIYIKLVFIERELKNLESGNYYDRLLSDFLKVLLSQDMQVFSKETLVSLLGDNYKDNRALKNLVIGDEDYTQFNNDSLLHKLVNMGIINYDAHERLFGKYSVSEDYWRALKGLYEEMHKSEKITFDSVYEHLFSCAK